MKHHLRTELFSFRGHSSVTLRNWGGGEGPCPDHYKGLQSNVIRVTWGGGESNYVNVTLLLLLPLLCKAAFHCCIIAHLNGPLALGLIGTIINWSEGRTIFHQITLTMLLHHIIQYMYVNKQTYLVFLKERNKAEGATSHV